MLAYAPPLKYTVLRIRHSHFIHYQYISTGGTAVQFSVAPLVPKLFEFFQTLKKENKKYNCTTLAIVRDDRIHALQ